MDILITTKKLLYNNWSDCENVQIMNIVGYSLAAKHINENEGFIAWVIIKCTVNVEFNVLRQTTKNELKGGRV